MTRLLPLLRILIRLSDGNHSLFYILITGSKVGYIIFKHFSTESHPIDRVVSGTFSLGSPNHGRFLDPPALARFIVVEVSIESRLTVSFVTSINIITLLGFGSAADTCYIPT